MGLIILLLSILARAEDISAVKYLTTYDGDTFYVEFTAKEMPDVFRKRMGVRVRGIDAPERHSKNECEVKASLKAKALLEENLKSAKTLELKDVRRDKYFRLLADVYVNGESVGPLLLKHGLAVSYDGGTKQKVDWCKEVSK